MSMSMSTGTGIGRRQLLAGGVLAGAAMAMPHHGRADSQAQAAAAARYGLNTGTIRGCKLNLEQEVEVAAKAGYGAIEPWVGSIRQYRDGGGSLSDLQRKILDLGLQVPSAIGFANWLADDPAVRRQGLEQARADMDLVRQIGGSGIAAPPAGMRSGVDLLAAAERYGALLELGREMGVTPYLEIWGGSPALSRIGQAAMVAAESGQPEAALLLDVYHIYKGGSPFSGLKLLHGAALPVLHMNDYPANPPRERLGDGDRVYPGDGVAPLADVLSSLRGIGFRGWLSLELFNREYWTRPALDIARTGLAKMQAVVGRVQPA
jgi:2-keto-myo-inositol isomerase